jgi:arginyl-tRNA synthetase
MDIKKPIVDAIHAAFEAVYQLAPESNHLQLTPTRKEYAGEFTLIVFPFVKTIKAKPEDIGEAIGSWLLSNSTWLSGYNVVKGFLNLELSDSYLLQSINAIYDNPSYWRKKSNGKKALVEFSSPNTNKPLHLGHIRNILLGWSVSKLMEACGYDVFRTQIINDRGIAICKSMVAWELMANGQTPESTGIKGDHFVGDYYVRFEQAFKEEYSKWQLSENALNILLQHNTKGLDNESFFKQFKNDYFNQFSELGRRAKEALILWEAGDASTLELWQTMNSWVYQGFEDTYQALGVGFDKNYYESQTYLLGKSIIQHGLDKGLFYQNQDGSVWVDLEDVGLDKKILLRSDGTSVYITQDLGTAELRYQEVGAEKMIYVVADEQNYHFQVLFETLKKYQAPYADGLYHLSYGMVELPEGKMKSREGTVVDADDLIAEVIQEAKNMAEERGELGVISESEKQEILRKIGLAALKFFMIKVHPKKRMIFDPKESVDMQGHTGPYIQNAYVRIQSILRKSTIQIQRDSYTNVLAPSEKELVLLLNQYHEILEEALAGYDPSTVANYCYTLAKAFHKFYHDCPILGAGDPALVNQRLILASSAADALRNGMDILGIAMPDRM